MRETFVIVGAGLTAGSAVVCLREEGFQGDLVLIGAEPEVPYDKVLIATGGRNRRPPLAGLDLEGVYDLRTVIDANRIRSQVVPGRKVVIAGMGFIGSEVAASLRMLGMEVSVIARSKLPLDRVLGEKIARVMESIHRDQGVEMVFEAAVESFEGSGRVERRSPGMALISSRARELRHVRRNPGASSRIAAWRMRSCERISMAPERELRYTP